MCCFIHEATRFTPAEPRASPLIFPPRLAVRNTVFLQGVTCFTPCGATCFDPKWSHVLQPQNGATCFNPNGATCFGPKWSHVLQPRRSHVLRPKMEPRASKNPGPFHRCLIPAAFKSQTCFPAYCSTRHSLGYYIRQQWPRNVFPLSLPPPTPFCNMNNPQPMGDPEAVV